MANLLAQSINEVIIDPSTIGSWALAESTNHDLDFPSM
jgi:hypothetical protein